VNRSPSRPFASSLDFQSTGGADSKTIHHQTDTNFYNSDTKKKAVTDSRDQFPEILAKLMEANQGTWTRDPNTAIDNFLKQDFLTTPRYHEDKHLAEELLHIRQDSSGDPVRRTFVGSSENFLHTQQILKKRQIDASRKLEKKKSSAFAGLLPSIGGKSGTGSKASDGYNRTFNKRKNETDTNFNKSQKIQHACTVEVTNPLQIGIKTVPMTKRTLTVGFGTQDALNCI